jgi:hypothetical protein
MRRIGTVALLMTLPLAALASTVWKGDFETGNLSQWSGDQSVASDRLQVVSSPAHEGQYALKVTVKQGDDPINASGNRNELFHFGKETEGSEYYYKWSTMFAQDFPSVDAWQLFTQWHHEGTGGSPPLEFYTRGERIFLRLEGRDDRVVWKAPLVRGQWLDFVLHVKWSSNPRVGFVELYYNGERVLEKQYMPTLFRGMRNYMKQGLYRDASVKQVGVIYHDGMVQATSLQDVLPAAQAPSEPVAEPAAPSPGTATQTPPHPGGSEVLNDPNAYAGQENMGGCAASGGSLGALGLLAALTTGARLAFRRRNGKR